MNIGHPQAYMKDLLLDFRDGQNSVVFADNGCGKSSIIALMLALIRPRTYDFLQGEGQEKRKLADYVRADRPGHIIIEWLFDGESDPEFFLTAMMLVRDQNEIRKFFYSLRYKNNESNRQITFDNLQLETTKGYLSHQIILDRLRSHKRVDPSQQIQIIRDNMEEWMKHLDVNQIDTTLAKTQVNMNKHEGAQAEFLTFSTDMEFIQFIVETLQEFSSDEPLDEIRAAYDQMQKLPSLEAQEEFVKKILENLDLGKELEQRALGQQLKKEELAKQWVFLSSLCRSKKRENKKEIENCNKNIAQDESRRDQLKKELSEVDQNIPYFNLKMTEFQIKGNKTKIKNLNRIFKKLKLRKSILEILPEYIDLIHKSRQLEFYKKQLFTEMKPIDQELMMTQQIIAFLLNEEYTDLSEKEDVQNEELAEICKSIAQKQLHMGEKTGIKRTLEKAIVEIKGKIETIAQKEDSIADLWKKDDESIDIARQRIASLFENIKSQISELGLEQKQVETDKENLDLEIDKVKDVLSNLQMNKKSIEDDFERREDKWKKLVSDPVFGSHFGEGWELRDVNYTLLNPEQKKKLIEEQEKLHFSLLTENHHFEDIKRHIETYEVEEHFPYDPAAVRVKDVLRKKHFNAWIGWEYLKKIFPDTENRERIAECIPHLLDGVIIVEDTLEHIIKVIESLRDTSELQDVTHPVMLSIVSVLTEPPEIHQNVWFVSPGLNWNFDPDEAEGHYQELRIHHKNTEKKVSTLKDGYNKLRHILHIWEDFLESFPEITYFDFDKKRINLNINIKNNNDELDKLTTQKTNLVKRQNELTQRLEELDRRKEETSTDNQTLEKFYYRYQEKIDLQQKMNSSLREVRKISELIDRFEHEIPLLMKKETRYRGELAQIQDKIKENNIERSHYSIPSDPETRLTKAKIQQKSAEMSLSEWRNIFHDLKQQRDSKLSSHQLNAVILNLETEIKELEHYLRSYWRKTKIREGLVEKYVKKNKDLSDKSIILARKQKIEEQITNSELKMSELEKRIRGLNKESEIHRSKCLGKLEELYTKLSYCLTSLELLKEALAQESQKEVQLQGKLIVVETRLEETKTRVQTLFEQRNSIKSNLNLIEAYKREFVIEFDELNISELSSSQVEKSPYEINLQVESFTQEIRQFQVDQDALKSDEEEFILIFRRLAQSIHPQLQETRIIEFVKKFDKEGILNRTFHEQAFKKQLVNLQEEISAPQERLGNIIKYFSSIIDDILYKLRRIQSIKLQIPELPYFDKKEVIRIKITDSQDFSAIEGTVKAYFHELFYEHPQFPDTLTIEKIVNDVLARYLDGRLAPIRFLFPENQPKAIYKKIDEIRKISGGESVTIAILLYCLIAYFRLKYTFGEKGTRSQYSYPLLMDNPFGKASRPDFIKLQVGLARNLRIQLIPFTHINDVETIQHFETFIPLRKYPTTHDGVHVVEIDPEKKDPDKLEYHIESSSVTVRPTIKRDTKLSEFVEGN